MRDPTAFVAISSYVARGSVGNRAVVFALETLGFPVWSVPTVFLPWHPGHGPSHRVTPDGDAFGAVLDDLSRSGFASEVRAILTGYMGSVAQVEATARFVADIRKINPSLLYICDPVVGDQAGLYVPEAIADAISALLVPQADMITPNRFEFGWLTGSHFGSNDEMVAAARSLGVKQTLITSAFALLKEGTGNLFIDANVALLAEHRLLDDVPNGTGDLTASLFAANMLRGLNPEQALLLCTQSVADILNRTAKRRADELTLALDQDCLRNPKAPVQIRQIGSGITVRRRVK